jgi:hypothetical protein
MAIEVGKISLDELTQVSVEERARVVHHAVPGLAGDLAQVMGRPSVQVTLHGIFYGADSADKLKDLRKLYLAAEPVDFFAEAVGEGYFAQVIISGLEVTQRAGEPDQFTYCCRVVEYVKPPEPAVTSPFAAIDSDLLSQASGFMDDIQNGLAQVSSLTSLLTSTPSFGDPTGRLKDMPKDFTQSTGDVSSALSTVHDLF